MTTLAKYSSKFVAEHLPRDRGVSEHTVEAYAAGLAAMFSFVASRLNTTPSQLTLEQVDPEAVLAFLEEVERRGASARTRNARLAAIKAFFRFVEWKAPAALTQAQRIRAIPQKRVDDALVSWLTWPEFQALLDAPDVRTREGIRDRAMLYVAYFCALRVSELTGLQVDDYDRRPPATIHVLGKGRKERFLPLATAVRSCLEDWLRVRDPAGEPAVFHNRFGRRMTGKGFAYIVAKHAATAAEAEPGISGKHVTPHVLRHSCAMHTLQATDDERLVSVWLGHASMQSTEPYLRANPTEKLEMLNKTGLPDLKPGRFRAPDRLLSMLQGKSTK